MATPTPLFVKDAATIREDYLRTLSNGLIKRGVPTPQLGPGSLEYVTAQAIGNEIAVFNSNVQVKADAQMPDTAAGADLDRLCAQYGIVRGAAAGSLGFVTNVTDANTYIQVGQSLVDLAGSRYHVTVAGTYTNIAPGNQVPIIADDVGTATNHSAGDVLRWTTAPTYSHSTVTVSAAGLAGGKDAESDGSMRTRLYAQIQSPSNNANWPQVAAIATASSPIVEAAHVYPAALGPSTCHIAVTQAAFVASSATPILTSTSKNRDIDGLNGAATGVNMAGTIVPYILGQMPEYVETITTGVINQPTNVCIGLSLPAPPSAVPAGPGGGWIDAIPWPIPGTYGGSPVSSVTSGTVFIANTTLAPTVGTHIAWIDPNTWLLNRAKVVAVSGMIGAWQITIDTNWANLTSVSFIFPDCTNAQLYADTVFAAFAALGPGEKWAPASPQLSRAYRHPLPTQAWPYSLGPTQLRMLSNAAQEILDVSWLYRQNTTPTVPGIPSGAPSILVPSQIGFYPL